MSQKSSSLLTVLLLVPLSVGIVTLVIMAWLAHLHADPSPADASHQHAQVLMLQEQVADAALQAALTAAAGAAGTAVGAGPGLKAPVGLAAGALAGTGGGASGQGLAGLHSPTQGQQAAPSSTSSTNTTTTATTATNTTTTTSFQASVAYNESQRRHATILPGVPLLPDTDPAPHCPLTQGGWCGGYWTQAPAPAKPPPRGSKDCPSNCHGRGWCNHDTGLCVCGAGYTGPACTEPLKRPCFNMEPTTKRDRDYKTGTWLDSRCAGVCDEDLGGCGYSSVAGLLGMEG